MKRKGISKQTIARYMAAFVEIKAAIDANPKCHTSQIAKQFKIGQHPITMLKKMGVIEQKNGRKKWIGAEPNVGMIVQIAEAVHNYHAELRSRKSNGEMFAKKKRVQTTKSVQPIQSDLDEWKSRYKQQNAQKTDIPIQTPLFDKSTADHVVENIGELESSKPAPRKFEVKIFGIKLFSINY
jgi:hypothetical protein